MRVGGAGLRWAVSGLAVWRRCVTLVGWLAGWPGGLRSEPPPALTASLSTTHAPHPRPASVPFPAMPQGGARGSAEAQQRAAGVQVWHCAAIAFASMPHPPWGSNLEPLD